MHLVYGVTCAHAFVLCCSLLSMWSLCGHTVRAHGTLQSQSGDHSGGRAGHAVLHPQVVVETGMVIMACAVTDTEPHIHVCRHGSGGVCGTCEHIYHPCPSLSPSLTHVRTHTHTHMHTRTHAHSHSHSWLHPAPHDVCHRWIQTGNVKMPRKKWATKS